VYGLFSVSDFYKPSEAALEFEKLAFATAKTIRNLGAILSNVEITDNGFTLSYSEGDVCDADSSKRYRTDVIYKCDSMGDSIGTPIINFLGDEDCKFEILWFSKYACRSCRAEDVNSIAGKCLSSGNRVYTYEPKETASCLIGSQRSDLKSETMSETTRLRVTLDKIRPCSQQEDINELATYLIASLLLGVVFMFACLSFTCCRNRSLQHQYDRVNRQPP
jgi:hypothetical protein